MERYEPALSANFCVGEWKAIESESRERYSRIQISSNDLKHKANFLAWECALAKCELERRKEEENAIMKQIKRSFNLKETKK